MGRWDCFTDVDNEVPYYADYYQTEVPVWIAGEEGIVCYIGNEMRGGRMSKARELLWTCLEEMQYYEVPCPELINEVKELLAQTEQEPDLWVVTNTWGVNEYLWSEPREQVYENYKVTSFYRLPPTREIEIGAMK